MADKNKMFFGTNKDTYIAADDAGNIILQTEHGSRTVLDTEGIKVGVGGAEPTVLQAGGGDATAATTENQFPEIWLEEVGGDGTKIPVSPLNSFAADDWNGGYEVKSKLIRPFYMAGGSFEKTIKYVTYQSDNTPSIYFSFPASTLTGFDPYSAEEHKEYDLYIDYKNTIIGIVITGADMYDPDYSYYMSNHMPKLRTIKAINAHVINANEAGIVMSPFNIENFWNHYNDYGFNPSIDIEGEDLFTSMNFAPNTANYDSQYSLTMETFSRLRAVSSGTLYVKGSSPVDLSNITHVQNLNIRVYNDPYASESFVSPESITIGSQDGEEFLFEHISIRETEIGSVIFPTNGKYAGSAYSQGQIEIVDNPNLGEDDFNQLIAFLEVVGPKILPGNNISIRVNWANNGYAPAWINEPYATKPANVQALLDSYPIQIVAETGASMP